MASDEDREFLRWHGRWAGLSPVEVGELMTGLDAPWWIVGGWAVDAFTGEPREHDDVDVGFFAADLPRLLEHLEGDYCAWSNASGTFRPLRQAADLLPDCRQIWVRKDGDSPWLVDLAMTPHDGETWISVRDDRLRLSLDEATFTHQDGIRYLRPEIVLHMKARHRRTKDERDFKVILPLLDHRSRAWLRGALELLHPGHPWIVRLEARTRANRAGRIS